MNMNETFVAEKRAAMHCDALVARADKPDDGLGMVALLTRDSRSVPI